MVQHHKSRILVTDEGGRLKGVISLSDLAQNDPGPARGGRAARGLFSGGHPRPRQVVSPDLAFAP